MADLFGPKGSELISHKAIDDGGSFRPALIRMKSDRQGFEGSNGVNFDKSPFTQAIITAFDVTYSAKHQVSESLGSATYVYGFGQNLATIHIRGLAFNGRGCDKQKVESGNTQITAFYDDFNVSNTDGAVIPRVALLIGKKKITGIMVSLQILANDTESLVSEFNITMRGIVEELGWFATTGD